MDPWLIDFKDAHRLTMDEIRIQYLRWKGEVQDALTDSWFWFCIAEATKYRLYIEAQEAKQ